MRFASPSKRLTAAHWALLAVCALFLLTGALALDDYGVSQDTRPQRAVGNAALDYLAGDGERALDQVHTPWDRYFGAAFEAPLVLLLERIIGLQDSRDVLLGRHLLTHLFFLAGGVFCYLLVLRLFNSRALALVAMVLFLLHPRLYAHSFFNSKDIPFVVMFMISLYLIHRAFRRDTLAAYLLCGAGVGLLVNLRVMGVILFAAVLALRALDVAFAGSAGERKYVLLTGGAFALTAMLTFHASLPALWTDPVVRFAEMVDALGSRPLDFTNLFRGELLSSTDGPPFDYLPVWVGITTPPATLLLALAGALALAWGGLRRPRDVLRNGPLRFGLLLAALPAVTAIAVVVLDTNVHTGWRHLYFLYAPLPLLAAFGLRRMASAPRVRWPRLGAYALTGAAVAVTVVSMVRIHPHQSEYFTVLADRATPERLVSRYETDYWDQAPRAMLPDIVGEHPSETIFLRFLRWGREQITILPPDERRRVIDTRDFVPGERNFQELRNGQPCPPRGAHVVRLYASTLSCMIEPVAYFRGIRRAALAMEPLRRAVYDIHRDGRLLTYVRDGCPRDDIEEDGPRFFLHLTPVDVNAVRPDWRGADARRYGFDNRDLLLRAALERIEGNCVAAVVLPDYPIAAIRTGQLTDDGVLWEIEITFAGGAPDYAIARREALAKEPLARSGYDVHLAGRTLTYLRDGCTDEEADARFFLHVVPEDEGDLPEHRREHGFDNLDFALEARGARLDGNCVAVARLPNYPVATVRTGQYDDTGARWTAEFAIPDGE